MFFFFFKLSLDEGGGIWWHNLPQRLFQGGFPHVKGLELLAVNSGPVVVHIEKRCGEARFDSGWRCNF